MKISRRIKTQVFSSAGSRRGEPGTTRDRMILKAVKEHGDSQVKVARYVKLPYTTVSRIVKRVVEVQG